VSASDLLNLVNQLVYVGVFLATLVDAVRHPRRATADAALLFGDTALIILATWLVQEQGVEMPRWLSVVVQVLLMALPYLLLRLVAAFANVSIIATRATEAGLVLAVVGLLVLQPLSVALILAYVGYFAAVEVYAVVLVWRTARRAAGVTRRRLRAVAIGSLCLGGVIVMAGAQAALPGFGPLWDVVTPTLALASGVAYALGFATPTWLRRAWQEPELRAFLARAAELTALPDTAAIARAIGEGTGAALGTGRAAVGLWDEAAGVLRWDSEGILTETRPGELIAGRAFGEQRALFSADAVRDAPERADDYRIRRVGAVMAAPITVRERRLGVLVAYAERAPVFAEDDLRLVELLADQAAVVLASRALVDEASRVRAEAEANRLREDFLSAAAHDLKTPLTTVVGRAQLLVRRLERAGDGAPAGTLRDAEAVVSEIARLRTLVLELLDASRVEQGGFVGARESIDLVVVAREVCDRYGDPGHPCTIAAEAPVEGAFDQARIAQLLDNLIENAVKYSPDGGPVEVRVWTEDGTARLSVSDRGIGVPAADLPHLFDRFRRAANVDDRRFAGLGLGLYICRGIVEGHGGRLWAESVLSVGTTIQVALPLRPAAAETAAA
jgi:signal transduction histidine kinase